MSIENDKIQLFEDKKLGLLGTRKPKNGIFPLLMFVKFYRAQIIPADIGAT